MNLYDKGIASGKVADEEHWNDVEARFKKLRDIAELSARRNDLEESKMTRDKYNASKSLLTATDLLIIAIFVMVILLAVAFGFWLREKRRRT